VIDCDAVVVGAGPAGAATALHLRRRGLRIVVLERARPGRFRIGETVPADIRAPLERLGLWPDFVAQGHLPSAGRASAWGTDVLAIDDAFRHPLGSGWHIDRTSFDALLVDAARQAGVEVRTATAGPIASSLDDRWSVEAGGLRVRARLLVDATGRSAAVARRLGARRLVADRLLSAYAVLSASLPLARSVVEAFEDGWWYVAPLPDGRTLAAMFTDPRVCQARGYGRPGSWRRALLATAHVASIAGAAPPASIRLVSATPHCLDRSAGVEWIAVGDAAAAYDPLSSSGLTVALLSAEAAATALACGGAALRTYSEAVHLRFVGYATERRAWHRVEGRWPTSQFWCLRRETSARVGSSRSQMSGRGPASTRRNVVSVSLGGDCPPPLNFAGRSSPRSPDGNAHPRGKSLT
jgi:flavin-dependent dehydrogenase